MNSVSVAKPLVADGSAKSHELSLAYDRYSLEKLEPPLVLQEFVNHGVKCPPNLCLLYLLATTCHTSRTNTYFLL